MSQNKNSIYLVIGHSLDIDTLYADFGKALPELSTELLRAVNISNQFADLDEIESLTMEQSSALGLWAAGVTPALEALTATLMRNNDRLAAAL